MNCCYHQRTLNNLKNILNLATDENNTYISVTPTALQDVAGNNLNSVTRRVSEVVSDETNPDLIMFNFDLNTVFLCWNWMKQLTLKRLMQLELLCQNEFQIQKIMHLDHSLVARSIVLTLLLL